MSTIIFANRKGQTKKNSRDDQSVRARLEIVRWLRHWKTGFETSFAYRSPRGGKINIDLRGSNELGYTVLEYNASDVGTDSLREASDSNSGHSHDLQSNLTICRGSSSLAMLLRTFLTAPPLLPGDALRGCLPPHPVRRRARSAHRFRAPAPRPSIRGGASPSVKQGGIHEKLRPRFLR